MKPRAQGIFDIKTEKYKYLNLQEQSLKKKVSIEVLNARLNETRKLDIYSNLKIIAFCSFCLIGLAIVTVYF